MAVASRTVNMHLKVTAGVRCIKKKTSFHAQADGYPSPARPYLEELRATSVPRS